VLKGKPKASSAIASSAWLALIKLLPVLIPRLSRQMREIPDETLSLERLTITRDMEKLYRHSGRYQPPRLLSRVTFPLQAFESLPRLRRIIVTNLILDNLQNRLSKLRIGLRGVHKGLTTRISDPAPLAPDLKQKRHRGVRCIRLVEPSRWAAGLAGA